MFEHCKLGQPCCGRRMFPERNQYWGLSPEYSLCAPRIYGQVSLCSNRRWSTSHYCNRFGAAETWSGKWRLFGAVLCPPESTTQLRPTPIAVFHNLTPYILVQFYQNAEIGDSRSHSNAGRFTKLHGVIPEDSSVLTAVLTSSPWHSPS